MKLFNSLTRKVEEFIPLKRGRVGMYICGPTVYSYLSIGNWRTYFLGDMLLRTLRYLGYQVDYVMNITDVGHLTGDNLGDADMGEDRLAAAAKREKKTAWDVAAFYTRDFIKGIKKLNLVKPKVLAKATGHIEEQIEMIRKIEKAGLAYQITDGVYFDVRAYEKLGNKYGELSTLDKIKEGVRVEVNKEKRDQRDFALWRFNNTSKKRDMEWVSPWGKGFPGWHIECSAMSCKYLGEQFDIHLGGEDLRSTHHPNEIAQAEVATGKKPFVNYWLHGAFLQVDGGRMGKSLGNAFTLADIQKKGVDVLALRYFYLTGYYRKPLNFTWEALKAAAAGYKKLVEAMDSFKYEPSLAATADNEQVLDKYRREFKKALENDLNTSGALAVAWRVVKDGLSGDDKRQLLLEFDEVLGLNLDKASKAREGSKITKEGQRLIEKRDQLRKKKRFAEADKIRDKLEKLGYKVKDEKI